MHKNQEVSNIERLNEKIRNLWSRILWSYHTYFWIFCCYLLSPWKLLLSTLNPCYSLVMAYYSYQSREYEGRWRFSDYPNGANLSIHWCVNSLCSAIMSNNRQRHKLFLLPPPQATFLPRAHTPHTHTYAHSTLCSEIWSAQPRSWFASVFTGQGCTDKTKEGGFRPVGGNYHPA